jgi:acyl-coenzyme A synthetase/AMP-(fatty) acid ligase
LERSYAALVALSLLDCDVYLLDAGMSGAGIRELADSHGLDAVIDPCHDRRDAGIGQPEARGMPSRFGRGRLTIYTSGSTGRPKPVCHAWHTLTMPVRRTRSNNPASWLLTYRPHLYVGLQIFFHCLLNRETLVLPEPGISVDRLLDLMRRSGVTAVSATPSYWRRLIALGRPKDLTSLQLVQITLGGELVDQYILDALKRLHPGARLVHIYATSEIGRCFSVKDGRSGFPAALLNQASEEGVEMKLEDGELHVRSVNSMLESGEGVDVVSPRLDRIATGDLVERVGDRCFFVGRRREVFNVGGNKVRPLRVEQVIQRVPGVRDVRVFGRKSSLVGQIVACEFVTEPGFDEREVKRDIFKSCLEALETHKRPRFVEGVSSITLSDAGKKIRLAGSSTPSDPANPEATTHTDQIPW